MLLYNVLSMISRYHRYQINLELCSLRLRLSRSVKDGETTPPLVLINAGLKLDQFWLQPAVVEFLLRLGVQEHLYPPDCLLYVFVFFQSPRHLFMYVLSRFAHIEDLQTAMGWSESGWLSYLIQGL